MSRLYELTQDFIQVQEMLETGEYDQETLQNTLDCIQCGIEEKAESIVKIIKKMEGEAATYKAEIERMTANKQTIENNIKRLKQMLQETMAATEIKKITTPLFKISIVKNGGVAPFEITGDVPDKYKIKPEPQPDNSKIRELLKTHEVDWAKLKERGTHLTIK